MRYIPFLIVYFIQLALTFPKFQATCDRKTLYSYSLYFIHHLLDVFLFWSFLFLTTRTDYLLHILLVVIVAIHWLTYDNLCILTVIMNRQCGYPDEMWLDSLKNMLGLRTFSEYFLFIWLGVLVAYDVFMLQK